MNEKIKTLETKEEIKTLVTNAELKAEQNKIVKLETHVLNYFLHKKLFCDDGSQNMFVYQPTFYYVRIKSKHKHWTLNMLLDGNQKVFINLNFWYSIVLSNLT